MPLKGRNAQGEEFSFELGMKPSDAMPGWEAAIPTMLEGEVGLPSPKPWPYAGSVNGDA